MFARFFGCKDHLERTRSQSIQRLNRPKSTYVHPCLCSSGLDSNRQAQGPDSETRRAASQVSLAGTTGRRQREAGPWTFLHLWLGNLPDNPPSHDIPSTFRIFKIRLDYPRENRRTLEQKTPVAVKKLKRGTFFYHRP